MMRGPLQTVRREAPANPFSRGSSFAGSSWQGPVGTEVVCVCVSVHLERAFVASLSLALVITQISPPRKFLPSHLATRLGLCQSRLPAPITGPCVFQFDSWGGC